MGLFHERHGVATLITYSGRVLRVWAERGLVHMEDSKDNSYVVLPVRTALEHLGGINKMIGNSIHETHLYRDEVEMHQKFIDQCVEVIRRAREQGTPDDPSAVRDLNARRAKSFVMPRAMDL